jgi:glycosyltransferase involved in cell wall biosynthesis
MNIWILNHHAVTPDMSGGTRHYDFAKELIKRGHIVTIIASSFHYSKYKEMREYKNRDYLIENIDGIEFIWFKTPPYFNNGFKRVINMLSYTKKAIFLLPKLKLDKPDIIIGSSVHLFAVYAALRLSKRYKIPFVMEVRDLWPQTLIDMGMSKYHPFIMILSLLEKYLYKKSDKIITLLPKANQYIEKLGIDSEKIVWISNGTNPASYSSDNFNILLKSNKFNVLYTGTHGFANSLDLLIDAADILKSEKSIFFTLVGDGPLKERLRKKADELGLDNIEFIPSVSKKEVFDYLTCADLLYVGLKDLPLYRYGMSMNKVFDYMAAKKPVLFVSNIKDNIIKKAEAGTVIEHEDAYAVAKSIKEYSYKSKDERKKVGEKGYDYLLEHYTISVLTDKLENLLIEIKRK